MYVWPLKCLRWPTTLSDLHGSEITSLPASVFAANTRLAIVFAHRITAISIQLRRILYGNKLTSLPQGIFDPLPELQYL